MTNDQDTDDDYRQLQQSQRLKAALHYGVVSLCRQKEDSLEVRYDRQVLAAIAETAWRQCQNLAEDLELFAKHAKRSTVNADDVKLVVRRAPKLLEHITKLHDRHIEGKQQVKKHRKKKAKPLEDVDEDSNL